jgi:legumain
MAMFKTFLLLSALVQHALADHYAVLVAGSHTYGNYRHHADVAHAYHVAIRGGVPSENIVVMMYDDVVNDQENPFPGQLFNQPTPAGTPGVDVYHGVKKDYTGKDVTAANFLSIITGDAAAMKNIINFVDHGGVGLIAFPNQPYLYKKDLQGALVQMHKSKM